MGTEQVGQLLGVDSRPELPLIDRRGSAALETEVAGSSRIYRWQLHTFANHDFCRTFAVAPSSSARSSFVPPSPFHLTLSAPFEMVPQQ